MREDRPHRESVPARQAPLPTDLKYRPQSSPFDVFCRTGTGARTQNANKPRRARQRTGQFGAGHCACRVRITCSLTRPGCPARPRWEAKLVPLARPAASRRPACRHPPEVAVSGAVPICPLPTQRTVRSLCGWPVRRQPLLSPAPRRQLRCSTHRHHRQFSRPRSLSSRAPWTVAGMNHS